MEGIHAQSRLFGGSAVPLKPQSPSFGKDIIIYDSAIQNQRQVALCAAFNGWLYSAFTFHDTHYNCPSCLVYKSEDNGITWNQIIYGVTDANYSEFA